jgi:hypothetical protein
MRKKEAKIAMPVWYFIGFGSGSPWFGLFGVVVKYNTR